jgi:hypothetical protein
MHITTHRALAGALFSGLALGIACAAADELDCPNFPEPKAKVQWVAPYMVFNGLPMSVKRFDSEQSPAQILAYYRNVWAAKGSAAPVENFVEPWDTIGAVRGKCFFSVQVQAAGKTGSTGLLSATHMPEGPRVIAADKTLPMMSGSKIINDIEHRDPGKTARTLLLTNSFSAESNADFYRRSLKGQGWQALSDQQISTAKGLGIAMILKRDLAEISMVFTRSGANTMVLATMMDKP